MRGQFSVFRKHLLDWFIREQRSLPWRTHPSLFGTVVSEFMLQQTQVDTVVPYFQRWMARFSGFAELAKAPEAEVLKLWEGLGYYSRARNLHRLAKSIVEEGIPQSPEDWRKRPGIGPYTAAAISSIAQGLAEPVIDGNVIRVLSRLENDDAPVRSSAEGQKRFLPLARKLIDPKTPGDFNEAMMELGATVCRKARPACLICPVRAHCQAAESGTQDSLPVIVRKPTSKRSVPRLFLIQKNRILLHFYPEDAPRLAGMAELPMLTETPDSPALIVRSRGISSERIRESIFNLPPDHTLSLACLAQITSKWVPLDKFTTISLSAPHRRWIAEGLQLTGL